VRAFAAKFAPSANKIELQKNEVAIDNIRQFYMDCRDEEHKYDILVSLYQLLTIGQSIIFCEVRPLRLLPVSGFGFHGHGAEGVRAATKHGGPDRAAYDGRGP
jgi:ATP-dependent RNA helicase DDX19/DBP5